MRDELLGVSSELPVFEDVFILFVADFVEIVHVELPYKGRKVSVPEVSRQDFLLEAFNIENGEVRAFLVPNHYI